MIRELKSIKIGKKYISLFFDAPPIIRILKATTTIDIRSKIKECPILERGRNGETVYGKT